jgi:signal transduction histidine kinase
VGVVDYCTPADVSLGIFYLIPVVIFAWVFGKRAGYIAAAVCACIWLGITLLSREGKVMSVTPYWNACMRVATFSVVAALVHARKQLGRKVDELVDERTTSLIGELAERKRSEQAIHNLSAQLSEAEEAERRKLAHDIHDTLGQALTVIKMKLQASISSAPDTVHAQRIKDALMLLEEIIEQTRTLTFELYPSMLDTLGLMPTLRHHAEQFKLQTGVHVSLSQVGDERKLPPHAATYLFRAIKELVTNAAKHGRAEEVLITIHWRDGSLRAVVDDDGCGFDATASLPPNKPRGLGLASISERLASLGGTACVESAEGKGARVILEMPLQTGSPLARTLAQVTS